MDLVLMGLLVLAGAGGGYAAGRSGGRQGRRLAAAVAALQVRNAGVDEALGRHAVNTQQLKDGLEALKGDLDRRLHLFDVDLNTADKKMRRLDDLAAAQQQQSAALQELRTLLEEEGERVKALAALQERNAGVNEALGRQAVSKQQLKDGLEALMGDLDRRLHLFDVDLNRAVCRLDDLAAAQQQQSAALQELRTVQEEESARIQELEVQAKLRSLEQQEERGISQRELAQLAAVVQRLEHATGNATGNAGRIEALELAQGVADGRLAQQELRLSEVIEHTSNLAKDTLASLRELKEELVADADAMNTRQEQLEQKQEEVFKMLENRLGEVQAFIVKAAAEARSRREATQAPAPMEQPASELSQLLAQQQAMANTFRARRQAQGGVPAVASVFPFLSGGREAGL